MKDLKFTSAGEYMQDIKDYQPVQYYVNEAGLKIDAQSGNLYVESPETGSQCLPP